MTAGVERDDDRTTDEGYWADAERVWREWADQLAKHLDRYPRLLLERDRSTLGVVIHLEGQRAAQDVEQALGRADAVARWYYRRANRDRAFDPATAEGSR